MVEFSVLGVNHKAWDTVIGSLDHTFGHSRSYNNWVQTTFGDQIKLFHATSGGRDIVLPFAEREFDGTKDVYSPFGWSGPTRTNEDWFWRAWDRFATDQGYVCSYIVRNPTIYSAADGDLTSTDRSAYVVSLDREPESLLSNMAKTHRNLIRRGLKEDRVLVTDAEEIAPVLHRLYKPLIKRVNARSVYRLSRNALAALCQLDDVMLFATKEDSNIVAAGVFGNSPFATDYLIGAATDEGRDDTRMLVWHAMLRSRSLGVSKFNLGGGIAPGDGLDAFKRRFGGRRVPVAARKSIYNEKVFRKNCENAGSSTTRSDFFPPYHR